MDHRTEHLGDYAVLLATFLLGAAAASRLVRLEQLLAILWWGAVIDTWSFYASAGPTRHLTTGTGFAHRLVFVNLPDVGTYAIGPYLGLVDLFAIAAILVICDQFAVSIPRLLIATAAVVVASAIVERVSGIADVPMVPDSVVPVWLEPALLLALLLVSVPLVPVELHAARDMAIRPPIRRAWYFFMLTPFVKVTPSWGHTFASEIG